MERGVAAHPRHDPAGLLATALGLTGAARAPFLAAARKPLAPPLPANHEKPRSSNLPAPLTPLIGRATEVATITTRLRRADVRLLMLNGPGGVSKTRLALQAAADVASEFRDGVRFVDMAALDDPRRVL